MVARVSFGSEIRPIRILPPPSPICPHACAVRKSSGAPVDPACQFPRRGPRPPGAPTAWNTPQVVPT